MATPRRAPLYSVYRGDNYFNLAARTLGSESLGSYFARRYQTSSGNPAVLRPGMRLAGPRNNAGRRVAFEQFYDKPEFPPTELPPGYTTGGSAPFTSGNAEDTSDINTQGTTFVAQTSTRRPANSIENAPLVGGAFNSGAGNLGTYDQIIPKTPVGAIPGQNGTYYWPGPHAQREYASIVDPLATPTDYIPIQPTGGMQGGNTFGLADGYYPVGDLLKREKGSPSKQGSDPTNPTTYVIPFGANPDDYEKGRFANTLNAVGGTRSIEGDPIATNPFADKSGSQLALAIEQDLSRREGYVKGAYQVYRPDGTIAITGVANQNSVIVPVYSNLGNIIGWRRDYTMKSPAYLRVLPGGLKQIGGGEGYPDLIIPPSPTAGYNAATAAQPTPPAEPGGGGGVYYPGGGGGGGGGSGFPRPRGGVDRPQNPNIQAAQQRRNNSPRVVQRPGAPPSAVRGSMPGGGRTPFEQDNGIAQRRLVTWRGI